MKINLDIKNKLKDSLVFYPKKKENKGEDKKKNPLGPYHMSIINTRPSTVKILASRSLHHCRWQCLSTRGACKSCLKDVGSSYSMTCTEHAPTTFFFFKLIKILFCCLPNMILTKKKTNTKRPKKPSKQVI